MLAGNSGGWGGSSKVGVMRSGRGSEGVARMLARAAGRASVLSGSCWGLEEKIRCKTRHF